MKDARHYGFQERRGLSQHLSLNPHQVCTQIQYLERLWWWVGILTATLFFWSSFGQVRSTELLVIKCGSLLVRREDNRCMCGSQGSWGRPEEGGVDQGTLKDGCGTRRQPQCHGSRCHTAQGSWIERAGQKPCRQGFGQLFLQGQFSLKAKTHSGSNHASSSFYTVILFFDVQSLQVQCLFTILLCEWTSSH